MSKRQNLVARGLVLVMMAVETVAEATSTGITVRPTTPMVDDKLIVSFEIDRRVPVHNSVSAVVSGLGPCATSLALTRLAGPMPAGKRVTLRFRPADQIIGPRDRWCPGRAKVRVTEAKGENFV